MMKIRSVNIHYLDLDKLRKEGTVATTVPSDPTLCGKYENMLFVVNPNCANGSACEYCGKREVNCEECILLHFQNVSNNEYDYLFDCEEDAYPIVTVHHIVNIGK